MTLKKKICRRCIGNKRQDFPFHLHSYKSDGKDDIFFCGESNFDELWKSNRPVCAEHASFLSLEHGRCNSDFDLGCGRKNNKMIPHYCPYRLEHLICDGNTWIEKICKNALEILLNMSEKYDKMIEELHERKNNA